MQHKHPLNTVTPDFRIDPKTREVIQVGKDPITLMQFDHNSEKLRFECPRYVDGHDMSLTDKVEVHFVNSMAANETYNAAKYRVQDLEASPDNPELVNFSWVVDRNATEHVGTLVFSVCFTCLNGTKIEYAWHTLPFSYISIDQGLVNELDESYQTIYLDNLETEAEGRIEQITTATLNRAIKALEDSIINDVQSLSARMDTFTKLAEGSTTGDAELIDARIGVDGTVYESAGTAVREQVKNVHMVLDNVDNFININQFVDSVNKFNVNDSRIRRNVFVNHSGYVEAAGYDTTHPIYVKKGYTYKMPFIDSMGTNNNMIFTDVDGKFISVEKGVIGEGYIKFTPSKSGYAVFNLGNRDGTIEKFMVCLEDEYPDEYVPFVNPFDLNVLNVLYGKTISFNGDSICAGAGFKGGYGKIIAEANNMVYQNVAVGGGTIAAETYSGDVKRHWVCRSIELMDETADYVILEGGVNDAALGVRLGVLSNGYSAELDDTTFIGAFESMLKQVVTRFAGKKIGYIAVHKMTAQYDSRNTEKSYYYAAKQCCEKWGVPFLDLNTQIPPLNNITTLKETFTSDADGWHPNEAGYRAFYVPKIEAWLKTL